MFFWNLRNYEAVCISVLIGLLQIIMKKQKGLNHTETFYFSFYYSVLYSVYVA